MKVTIHYCPPCGLREPAERIAEALEYHLNLGTQLEEGSWGAFRVEVDGEVIFNRWKDRGWLGRLGLGKIPGPEEIVPLIRERMELDARISQMTNDQIPMTDDQIPMTNETV